LITKYQFDPLHPMFQVNVSVGLSREFNVIVNVWEKNETGMMGEGNVTGGSVGTPTQEPVQVKLASNESA
jgi:hypothetical protein